MTHYTHNLNLCRITSFSLGFLILAVAAGGAFGVVWMRKGVAENARDTAAIEQHIKQAERRAAALDARIAKAHSPQYLTARMPADLRPTQSNQIIWMPRAQPLAPSDYHDPTLATPEPSLVVATQTGAPRAPSQIAAAIPAPRAPAQAAPAAEETPLSITFDLALINRQRATASNSP